MNDQAKKLTDLAQEIIAAGVTPGLRAQATQLVFGDGNPNAEIVLIGEAPGKKEDELGKPFVGASGKFLDEMLAMIGLARKDIYITNIVKYRPPNNRDPSPEEKKAFLPYLQAQLEIIQPKVVVTLGRHSMNCFLPGLHIGECHGQPKKIRVKKLESRVESGKNEEGDILELVILPLFHPAAALYNGSLRQTLIDDFMEIPIILKKLKSSK